MRETDDVYDILNRAEFLTESEVNAAKMFLANFPDYIPVIKAALDSTVGYATIQELVIKPAREIGLDAGVLERIENGEVLMAPQLAAGHGNSYCHTVGLAPKLGCEVLCSGFPVEMLKAAVGKAMDVLENDPTFSGVYEGLGTNHLHTGEEVEGRFYFHHLPLRHIEGKDLEVLGCLPYYYDIQPEHELVIVEIPDDHNRLSCDDNPALWSTHQYMPDDFLPEVESEQNRI